MLTYGNYRSNIDVDDKYGVTDKPLSKRCIGSLNHLKVLHKWKVTEEEPKNQALAAAVVGMKNSHLPLYRKSLSMRYKYNWTDIDDYEDFADRYPTGYIIIGKPGNDAFKLGEALSQQLKCVHLCPINIIKDELEQNTSTAQTLDFNMRHYNAIKFNTLLKLLNQKIKSEAVRNRGYIISGFPLISTQTGLSCYIKNMHSEEALLEAKEYLTDVFENMKKKKKKEKIHKSSQELRYLEEEEAVEEEQKEEIGAEEEAEEEEEEAPVELPEHILDPCSNIKMPKKSYYIPKKSALVKQFNHLFKLDVKPDIIIYLTSPDEDLVTKRSRKFLDYKSNLSVFESFSQTTIEDVNRWPPKYVNTYTLPPETVEFNSKYACKQPYNFSDDAVKQLCNYKAHVFPFLEKKLIDINPKNLIKVDGRRTLANMLIHVLERLSDNVLVRPVHIPDPLMIEEPPEEMEEFWENVNQNNEFKSNVINFNYFPSLWYNRCPVELKKRHTVRGKIRYAVKLFKHVFLLSSVEALVSFWKNPRPFLDLRYLEPVCRIIVTGTRTSGKSMISECLAWIFDSTIIDFDEILRKEKAKKYSLFSISILSEIIGTIEDERYSAWQNAETNRLARFDEWVRTSNIHLKKYTNLLQEYEQMLSTEQPTEKFMTNFKSAEDSLAGLPFLHDLKTCLAVLEGNEIEKYAPGHLINETPKPKTPSLGDSDVEEAIQKYIQSNDLQKEIDVTPEEVMLIIINMITAIDNSSLETSGVYGKYIVDGFASDPEYWELLGNAKLLPDNTIALVENREIDFELYQQYVKIGLSVKDHQSRFLAADDPLIKISLRNKPAPKSNLSQEQVSLLAAQDMIDSIIDYLPIEEGELNEPDVVSEFSQSVETFRENWDTNKIKLEENFKSVIEIEIGDKYDLEIIEEVLLKLRRSYCTPCEPLEEEEDVNEDEDQEDTPINLIEYNDSVFLCETKNFCPIAYYEHGVLWEGKKQFSVKYDNKMHYFCKEECLEKFQNDPPKYQTYNSPFKYIPPLRICVIGGIGSGKTTISKLIAKELGLIHIDFVEIINDYLMPRHFKKVGRPYENIFTDISFDEEAVVEFQMGEETENMASDLLSNEFELRRMIYYYFERGMPIVSVLMQKIIRKIWFEDPFLANGFVLDGYPRLPNDIEDMALTFCVPNMIIELEINSDVAVERLEETMFKIWKSQLNEAKAKHKKKFMKRQREWRDKVAKNIIAKVVVEDLITDVVKFMEPEPEPEVQTERESTTVDNDYESEAEASTFYAMFNEFVEENPAPVDERFWEKNNEARERINERISAIFEGDEENIQSLKESALENKLKIITIDATKPLNKVKKLALSQLTRIRSRCESFFEQTFLIDIETAYELIKSGYYFFSKFRYMGPVTIYEAPFAIINPYHKAKREGSLKPVVHRNYIYFCIGNEAVNKFRTNPLKYIVCDSITKYSPFRLRIGIIGGPKSGKSSLAKRLSETFGLLILSKGSAIRYVLENLYWTKLGTQMKRILAKGQCIDKIMIVQAVQAIVTDYRTQTTGYIFDGFPDSSAEANELVRYNLYPIVMYDLSCEKDKMMTNSQNEIYNDIIKRLPPYSLPLMEYRFNKWRKQKSDIRDYIESDYKNLTVINANQSRWQCLQDARAHINSIMPKIHRYIEKFKTDIVSAEVMCITRKYFEERMSKFKNFCPVCFRHNTFKHNEYPVDRSGTMFYRGMFYWACDEHRDAVMANPSVYLSRDEMVHFPELPAPVKHFDHASVYENGVCIVTYAINLPSQVIKTGSYKYAASLNKKIYLFCDQNCLSTFMARPYLYNDIRVFKQTSLLPEISLKKLPNIGYLEQTVGNILTMACCAVNVLRPKYPGLDVATSGAIFIGLYLKVYNPMTNEGFLPHYKKAFRTYESRSKMIVSVGLRLRSMDNPFVKYPKCCEIPPSVRQSEIKRPSPKSSTFLFNKAPPSQVRISTMHLDYKTADDDDVEYFIDDADEDAGSTQAETEPPPDQPRE